MVGSLLSLFSKPFDYHAYLRSNKWNKKRKKVLKRDGYKCQLDYRHKGRLEVHHKTYERIGKERLSDLITLCSDCHRIVHNK